MGILRTDRITGLGGANAIKGSAHFHGGGDCGGIETEPSTDFQFGSSNFTIEVWANFSGFDSSGFETIVKSGNTSGSNSMFQFDYKSSESKLRMIPYVSDSSVVKQVSFTPEFNKWYHLAAVRSGNNIKIFIDGTQTGGDLSFSDTIDSETTGLSIGKRAMSDENNGFERNFNGYLSNLRIVNGTAIYTADFTPPTHELEKTSDTVLLALQSPGNLFQEATGKKLYIASDSSSQQSVTPSRFTPNSPVGFSTTTDVGSQYGSTFDGFGNFATSTYMVPPGGNTRERNRGRGLIGQGSNTTSPSNVKAISFIEIQSGGTAFDFGDSTNGSMYAMTAVSSSTRAVFAGGHTSQSSPYPTTNLIEFVTIANTSNCTDFGDLDVAAANRTGVSNQTRGLIAGGYSPNTRQIDKIEIATLGNATDYGDLTDQGFYGLNQGGMVSSTTRGLYAGGSGNSAPVAVNTITFSLFSTSGNSTDFGDLTHTNGYFNVGNSNGVRGVFMGGSDIDSPYAVTDQIDLVTIATAGNATDFGSLSTGRYAAMGASNSTRGVIAGGRTSPTPSLPATNLMEFITIASTGNGSAFGELIEPERSGAGCSDSHGGLS